VAVPWKLLTEAGHRAIFFTEHGATAPMADRRLLTGVLFGQLGADPEPKSFYAEMIQSPQFQRPLPWNALDVDAGDALLLAGGHAPGMRQYLGSIELQSRVARFFDSGKPTAAICHGVLLLARARGKNGLSVLHERRTTSLTKLQERLAWYLTAWKLGRYYRTYPAYVEDEVRSLLRDPASQYLRGPLALVARGTRTNDAPAFCVEDGNYVSARWPGDAYLFARKLLERLG
jgi:putative intracellular protease/amidase